MKKIRNYITSLEFIFALYLLAGYYKNSLSFITVDITLILLVVTVLGAFFRIKRNGFRIKRDITYPIIFIFITSIFMIISLLFTPNFNLGVEKTIRFLVITSWCLIGPFFIIEDKKGLKRFIVGILSVTLILGIGSLLGQNGIFSTGVPTIETNYLSLGRTSTMGSMLLSYYAIYSNASRKIRIGSLILSVLLMINLLQTGSRLPVFLFAFTMILIFFSFFRVKKRDLLIDKRVFKYLTVLFLAVVVGSLMISKGYADTFIYRLEVLFTETGGGTSASNRTDRIITAVDMIKQNIFLGGGIGSFGYYFTGKLANENPHNIYLEFLAEVGIVPFLMFILLIVISFKRYFRVWKITDKDYIINTLFILSSYWLINSLISSSMIDDKVFYACLGIMYKSSSIFLGRKPELD